MTLEKISEWIPTYSCGGENSGVLSDLHKEFLCGTEPDRTKQLRSTFMELVGLWDTIDSG